MNLSHVPAWRALADYVATLVQGAPASVASFAEDDTVEYPFQGVVCNDYDVRISSFAESWALNDMENRVAPDTVGSLFGHGAVMGCAGLPKAANPQRPLKIKNAPKILVTNARYDPATVYAWAADVHRQSRDTTVLVTYEGWGHGVYGRSACTMKINDDYLVSRRLPREGTTCAAVEPTE